MISARELEIWILELSEEMLEALLEYLIDISLKLEVQINRLHRKLARLKHSPTFWQYANRLIEYFDASIVIEAYRRLEALVNAGVAPDHAFHMITHLR